MEDDDYDEYITFVTGTTKYYIGWKNVTPFTTRRPAFDLGSSSVPRESEESLLFLPRDVGSLLSR